MIKQAEAAPASPFIGVVETGMAGVAGELRTPGIRIDAPATQAPGIR